ncbi:MAG: hypothetical protein M1829_000404 [Trizodia sp. TS-e1964]|nr:MAG: hypothetical protein M1829_000404 [Trizodia sp. TS-e1964]
MPVAVDWSAWGQALLRGVGRFSSGPPHSGYVGKSASIPARAMVNEAGKPCGRSVHRVSAPLSLALLASFFSSGTRQANIPPHREYRPFFFQLASTLLGKMRTTFLLSALAAGVLAAPRAAPQDIDFEDMVESAPTPTLLGPDVTALSESAVPTSSGLLSAALAAPAITPAAVDSTSSEPPTAEGKIRRRGGDCSVQPAGAGPGPSSSTYADTPQDWLAYPYFASLANNAAVPSGYSLVFKNSQASLQQAGYMGLHTLSAYDPALCASYCDSAAGCQSFDLYIERDPTVDPGVGCENPTSLTNYKCTLYGAPISAAAATNGGEYRGDDPNKFHVVITGSNGYTKFAPPTIPGFTGPEALNCAINAPDSYMGYKFFSGDLPNFNVTMCSEACKSQTAYNSRHPAPDGSYQKCTFFNAYALLKNNVYSGITCSLYGRGFGKPYNNNCGQTRGSDHYTVVESFGYNLTNTL